MREIIRGNTRTFRIKLRCPDGSAHILSAGERAIFAVKKDDSIGSPMLVKKILTAADMEGDEIRVKIRPEDTMGLESGIYRFDMGILSGSDFITCIAAEDIIIAPAVGTKEDME